MLLNHLPQIPFCPVSPSFHLWHKLIQRLEYNNQIKMTPSAKSKGLKQYFTPCGLFVVLKRAHQAQYKAPLLYQADFFVLQLRLVTTQVDGDQSNS